MALALGYATNPLSQGVDTAEAVAAAGEDPGQWLLSALLLLAGALGMTLGVLALLTLFNQQGLWLRATMTVVYTTGTIGLGGYAVGLLVIRAGIVTGTLTGSEVETLTGDPAVTGFVVAFLFSFLAGISLLAIGVLRAHTTRRWIPVLLLAFVVSQFVPVNEGDVGTFIQFLVLAVACTGAAITASDRASMQEQVTIHGPSRPPSVIRR